MAYRRLASDGEDLAPITADLMTTNEDPAQLSLSTLAENCARETQRFFERQDYDPRYCFELIRRAISQRDERAWELVYHQYRPLVTRWIYRHTSFRHTGEEAQYFVNRAFEKMWSALAPERFARFNNLAAVLRYLQMCAHSCIMDQLRAAEPTVELDEDDGGAERLPAGDPPVEERVGRQQRRRELCAWLDARLKNEAERCVLHGCFVQGLKPAELYEQQRDQFGSVQEIYRVKENLLDRLRRDQELEAFLGDL